MKNTFIIIFLLASALIFAQNITPIANIQDSLTAYTGQTVTVQGVVTIGDGLLYPGKTQFYVQDNSGRGIQIFDHTPLATTYVRGDLIEVTGEIGLYTGSSSNYYNVQVNDPVVTLISQSNDLPDPYPANGYEDTTLNGTWANANGEIVDIWDSTYGFYQITIDINGIEMDLQFWDSTNANVEEYIIGDVIIAHGIVAFYQGAPQFSCAYEEDIGYYQGGDTTPPQIVSVNATALTSLRVSYSEQVDQSSAEAITNYAIDNGLTINSAVLQANQSEIVFTTSEQTGSQNYTLTVNNLEDLVGNIITPNSTFQFTGYESVAYDQIADIQNNLDDYIGQEVTVKAIVTIGDDLLYSGKTQFYLQDESGRGIQVFAHTPLPTTYVRGDLLEVTGEIDLYTGSENKYYNVQVTNPVATLLSQNNELPEPYEVDGFEDFDMNGTWASATGEIADIWPSTFGFYQITLDVNGVEMDLQFWDSTGANVEEYIIGEIIIAHGIIAFYEGTPQLSCAYEEDVEYSSEPEPDPDDDDYPYGDISERIPGEPVNITFTDTLEFTSVIMHWKTNKNINYDLLEMTISEADENIYEAEVPAQGEGTMVEFYIIAADTSGNEFIFPEEETGLQSYSYNYKATSHIAVLNIPAKAFNPYSGESFHIEFGAEQNDKAILRIYNAEGKLERTLFNDIITNSTGISQYDWDGRDKENNLLPLGLYICFLEVIDTEKGNKKTAKAPIVIGAPLK